MNTPKLSIVGVGPGEPELITLKGLNALTSAEVIFTPVAAEGKPSLALGIVQSWIRPHQAIVPILIPMTRDQVMLDTAHQQAAETIAQELSPGRSGVYILLGDPMLYGTFTAIAERLRSLAPNIRQEIIPGVTSISAAAAATETPLATGSERLAILPGVREQSAMGLMRLLGQFRQIAIMKAGPALPRLMDALQTLGLVEDAVYVERLGLPGELIVRGNELTRLPRKRRSYLSLLLLRQRKSRRKSKNLWPEAKTFPVHLIQLQNKRVVVVGGGPVGERKLKALLAAGAHPMLISPDATDQIQAWVKEGRVQWRRRSYVRDDLKGAHLAFAATNDRSLNATIARDASEEGVWCNVADDPLLGDFHMPAVHREDGLVVSVGTEGQAPARASALRDRIAQWLALLHEDAQHPHHSNSTSRHA